MKNVPSGGGNGLDRNQTIPSPDALGRVKLSGMETITRQVGELRANERSAAVLLPGHRLRGNERLILQFLELDVVQATDGTGFPARSDA